MELLDAVDYGEDTHTPPQIFRTRDELIVLWGRYKDHNDGFLDFKKIILGGSKRIDGKAGLVNSLEEG